MVNSILLLGGLIVGIIFFSRGGLGDLKDAFGDLGFSSEQMKQGTTTIPELQTGMGSVPIASGSQETVGSLVRTQVLRTNVADKRKFVPTADRPPIQVFFNNPKEGGVLETQKGQIVGANLSIESGSKFGTAQFGLSADEVKDVRSRDFTDQERQDIANLTLRFNRKSASSQKVSDSPEEIVFKKREQELIAKKVLGQQNFIRSGGVFTRGGNFIEEKGGLFGKTNFALGGKTPAEFQEQQREKSLQEAKIAQNKILNQQRIETGEQLLVTIKKSGLNQKQFLKEAGVNLQGANLNPKALARLRERGLI